MPLRKTQLAVIDAINKAIDDGYTDIFVQAPTGVGKSIIALELAKQCNSKRQWESYLLTSEKVLQQQYESDCQANGKFGDDYTFVSSVSGIDTYTCDLNGEPFSCGVCRSLHIGNSDALKTLPCAATCEYLQRWSAARDSTTAIMNYAYYLIQMNYVLVKTQDRAPFQKRHLVICDEAHKLPDIIEGHFACRVDERLVNRIDEAILTLFANNYKFSAKTSPLRASIQALLAIDCDSDCQLHCNALKKVYDEACKMLGVLQSIKSSLASTYAPASMSDIQNVSVPKPIKQFNRVADAFKDFHCKIEDYIDIVERHGTFNLVADDDPSGERIYHNMNDEKLFAKHFQTFSGVRIYMSATLQPDVLIKRWNLNQDDVHVIEVGNGWDAKKSPVILCNTCNFSYAETQAALPKCVAEVDRILDKHKGERGIIHTTTFQIQQHLLNHSKHSDRFVVYENTSEKMDMLLDIESLPNDSIIMGPSLTTGVDLPDNLGRFNIIVKLSYPNLGSRLWARRAKYRRHIYLAEAASTLEQSAGRTTRHKDDASTTYIIDDRALSLIASKTTSHYFSNSFIKRVVVPRY